MKPSFLLDSNACIAVLRNKTGLEALPNPALTGIPVIVAAELWTGVKKNLKTHPHQVGLLIGINNMTYFDCRCSVKRQF